MLDVVDHGEPLARPQSYDLAVDRLALFESAHGARFEALAALADDVHALTIVTHSADDRHVGSALVADGARGAGGIAGALRQAGWLLVRRSG